MTNPNLFDYFLKNQTYVMYTPEVIRSSNLINLFEKILKQFFDRGDKLNAIAVKRYLFTHSHGLLEGSSKLRKETDSINSSKVLAPHYLQLLSKR